jgi:hypothetical protein
MEHLILTKEEFLSQLKTNFTDFKNKHTVKNIAEYMISFGLTNKSLDTLKTKGKDFLKKEALNFENLPTDEAAPKKFTKDTDDLASSFVDFLEGIKQEFQGSKFNKFLKERIIKSLEKLIIKIDDSEKLEKMGTFGNILVCIVGFIDVFVDFKTVPKKFKEFKEKRKKQHEQKQQNTIKQ